MIYKGHSMNKVKCVIYERHSIARAIFYIFFPEFFFHKCKFCIFFELVGGKSYFNLGKIFVLRLFKICGKSNRVLQDWIEVCYQIFAGWQVQSIWNFRTMSHVHRETCFSKKKMFTNGLNKPKLKRLSKEWKRTNSPVKKGQGAVVSEEGHFDRLLGHERTHHN